MQTNAQQTIGEIATEIPGATRVFEKAGIDYCCGGKRSLEDACQIAGIPTSDMLETLASLESGEAAVSDDTFVDWTLERLCDHIVSTHHVFTLEELKRLDGLLAKVRSKHEGNHPELADVGYAFTRLYADLLPHMRKEEVVLFPYIILMERARSLGQAPPAPPFGTVQNPIRMMLNEHDIAGDLLTEIRAATGGFEVPADACASFRALYEGLHDLERDLHQHIHLENNILFPRAAELEG
jgi:regulator of cell morphogenesis and NO signaling